MLADSHVQRFSILGGEPLEPENLENLYTLIQKIKSVHPHIKIWLYTGNTTEKIFDPKNEVSRDNTLRKWIWRTVDIVVDGQYIDAQRDPSLDYRGSANQRIIDVKKSIESGHIITIDSFRM
jgi:anaerobic ribonucleoside-triphosphate reductase activating protein